MYKESESRKIVPFSSGYMSLKQNGNNGDYHRHGRQMRDVRALLNYVQNVRVGRKFDFSEVEPDLREKLEAIVAGTKTVTDRDWKRAKV